MNGYTHCITNTSECTSGSVMNFGIPASSQWEFIEFVKHVFDAEETY
jgi:hypothetical protein